MEHLNKERLARDKHTSLFDWKVIDEGNKFLNIDTSKVNAVSLVSLSLMFQTK